MNRAASSEASRRDVNGNDARPLRAEESVPPGRRVWLRFKRNRLGYWSLIVFVVAFVISFAGPLWSNDKPLVVRYQDQGHFYFPLVKTYAATTFGGDFPTPADYLDPLVRARFSAPGNFAIYPPNHYYYDTLNYFSKGSNPAPPSRENWLGTDDRGRDVFARLVYGFRVSVLFALVLTAIGTALGVMAGAVQGYFGGRIDITGQRLIEIWSALPELYLLIIFTSIFEPSLILLIILLSLFGWIGLSDYVRAARAMGLSNWQIIWRHVLPNSLTPVITFLPFRMSGAILALTSLDFLGMGVPSPTPSLGELLAQGKANLDAWWISLSTFGVLVATLLLLTFMGDALRNALDTRIADAVKAGGGQ
ncbi:Oligopeptide transport system permease protein OppC (TC 3.A.1.5.1) [Candidatus Paraburkholderia kirkii UZHbot1]|uniref:Oligopeptide transport system permease protein OppC (TC 3.A.1.5.1) n=1 Tax=Candidatus Paraburkholderia kirkii UZHbot1 TaxID=1055526 RepID=G4MCU3_9BURK|nr:Oligopeptide transport system permease protein OppC (TC 3.A.1.5.1) [Candidatus Paraburkholderia kirkii UZHbot1]